MLTYFVFAATIFAASVKKAEPSSLPKQWFCVEDEQELAPVDEQILKNDPQNSETEALWDLVRKQISLTDEPALYPPDASQDDLGLENLVLRLIFAPGKMWDVQSTWDRDSAKHFTADEKIGGKFWPKGQRMPSRPEAMKFFDEKTKSWTNRLAKQVKFIRDGLDRLKESEPLDFWTKQRMTQYEAFAVFLWTKTGPAQAWQVVNMGFRYNVRTNAGPTNAEQALESLQTKFPGYVEYFYLVLSAMRKIRVRIRPGQAQFNWADVAEDMPGWTDPYDAKLNPNPPPITLSRGQHCPDFGLMESLANYVSSQSVFELRGFTTNRWASCLFSYGTLNEGKPAYDGSKTPRQVEVMGCEWANSFIHIMHPDTEVMVALVYKLSGFPQEYEHALMWGSKITRAESDILFNERECQDKSQISTPGCPKGEADQASTTFNVGITKEGYCGKVTTYWPKMYTEDPESLKFWADTAWKRCKPFEQGGGVLDFRGVKDRAMFKLRTAIQLQGKSDAIAKAKFLEASEKGGDASEHVDPLALDKKPGNLHVDPQASGLDKAVVLAKKRVGSNQSDATSAPYILGIFTALCLFTWVSKAKKMEDSEQPLLRVIV